MFGPGCSHTSGLKIFSPGRYNRVLDWCPGREAGTSGFLTETIEGFYSSVHAHVEFGSLHFSIVGSLTCRGYCYDISFN